MLLLVTPPLTQLNTPYPATTQLKAYLQHQGFSVVQADMGIELTDKIFRRDFIAANLPKGLPDADAYAGSIDSVMRFLRGGDSTLASRIVAGNLLPAL